MNMSIPDPNSNMWECPAYVVLINETGNSSCVPDERIVDLVRNGEAAILLPSIIYTAILMVLGLPGNFAVIFVYLFKMDKTPSRRFFISLAVCDFVNCSFGMPVELGLLSNFYTFDYPWLCRISRFMNYFLNNTSSCLHIAIAFDRYRRVRYPLRPAMTVGCFKLVCIIAVIFSFISACPALFIYGTKSNWFEIPDVNRTFILTKTCHVDDSADKILRLAFSIYLLIATLLTFFMLITLYALITRVLVRRRTFLAHAYTCVKDPKHKSTKSARSTSTSNVLIHLTRPSDPDINIHAAVDSHVVMVEPFRDRTHSDMSGVTIHGIKLRVGRTTFILFIVTLVFMLSFIPHLVIINMRYTNQDVFTDLSRLGWQVFHVGLRSYLLNSAVNPMIYCFLNKDFRTKVCSVLKSLFFICKQRKSGS